MLPMNNCGMSNTVYDSKPDDKRAPGWRSRKIIMEAYSYFDELDQERIQRRLVARLERMGSQVTLRPQAEGA